MKLLLILLLLLVACAPVREKVFVANEESGSISVIDVSSLKEIDRISLAITDKDSRLDFSPHNVQVVGNKVLITANVAHKNHAKSEGGHGDHEAAGPIPEIYFGIVAVEAHGDDSSAVEEGHSDQLVIMDAKSHKIVDRIDLDIEAHLAHVVSDGKNAYVTSTDKEGIYVVDLASKDVSMIPLPKGSMPHGARLTSDNKFAVIAAMGNALLLVNLQTNNVESVALPGKGVQAGVVGNIAMASVFDTKQLALYNMDTKELSLVDLPGALGPIQMYWTSDSKYVYVADQGVYFGQPPGRNTYKIDLAEKEVVAVIDTGDAPHGAVVSPDNRVWVTNLNGNSVSVIQNDQRAAEIQVGAAPNGISYWSAQ
jgi:YVTN family beta-propeller protein